ncbi:hypothetical protein CY34DRAFT_527628 [Suillus luteus UH-Slu-Lm8-n1]|uniref:Uncharacterized protein n=1 Tax=Suillus luteus UH-Slu-Lm8-n1 TaxID=930992 RepID=A0A0C9ZFX6_9AGAM|nr:hypothetical protein CY34DRAFT_527628 [Suillus luteus UH-Slu-Lm8-n1]
MDLGSQRFPTTTYNCKRAPRDAMVAIHLQKRIRVRSQYQLIGKKRLNLHSGPRFRARPRWYSLWRNTRPREDTTLFRAQLRSTGVRTHQPRAPRPLI